MVVFSGSNLASQDLVGREGFGALRFGLVRRPRHFLGHYVLGRFGSATRPLNRCSYLSHLSDSLRFPTLACLGAGDGNRTHAASLGSSCSTIELHPLLTQIKTMLNSKSQNNSKITMTKIPNMQVLAICNLEFYKLIAFLKFLYLSSVSFLLIFKNLFIPKSCTVKEAITLPHKSAFFIFFSSILSIFAR